MMQMRSIVTLSTLLICIYGCGQKSEKKPLTQSIDDIYEIAAQKENLRSLIVFSDNVIVAERYYRKYSGDSLDHLRSATKSIMSLLIGIAIDQEVIGSVDDKISKYIKDVPEDKQGIRIRNLLNMTSGITWDEGIGYNDNNRMVDSGNPLKHMMNLSMTTSPGSSWEYSTGDIHLLSVVLSEASGMSTRDFADKYLFHPLGITVLKWQTFGDGYTSGGSRLQMKPRDMLKIGLLCLNDGMFNGQQIVSTEYLKKSTDIHYSFAKEGNVEEGYGYCWWTINVDGIKAYMASGYGGQTIAVIPDHRLVIVATHNWRVSGEQAIKQQDAAQGIAKAVWEWKTGESPIPAN